MVIEESVLNHTILEIELLYQDEFKYLPEGIVAAAHKGGKDKIKYNTILSGECNTYFSSKGVLAYRKVHPRDVLWLEHLGQGDLKIWVFLEKGTFPDQDFFEIIE